MKGIVFNLLEELVTRDFGADAWDDLLDSATVHGAYTSLGSYPDGDFHGLVDAAAAKVGRDRRDIIRWLGRESVPLLAARYPGFFSPHEEAAPFLLSLNEIIHPEVRKIYPGADVPVFGFDLSQPPRIGMTYDSPRRMCAFAEGLIQGAAAHYGERVMLRQPTCMHRGDPECRFEIEFSREAG